MATVAELAIVLEAQDRASGQLRQVGAEVARLSQTVAQAGAGVGAGPFAAISGVADALRIVEGAARAVGAAVGGVLDQIRQGFESNIELERATVAFRRFAGSAEGAAAVIADLRREAATSPFNDQEVIAAGRALAGFAQGSRQQLLELVRVAEQLGVADPTQGIVGGVRALQEALGGNFTSLFERFEIPLNLIQRWRQEGLSNLEVVKRALDFRGIDASAIEAYGRTFEGLQATLESFGGELRQLATAGLFRDVGQAFAHMVNLLKQYGDQLRTMAAAIGEVFSRMAQGIVRAIAPVLNVLDALMPGLREAITAEFAAPIEEVQRAAELATPALTRLGEALSLPGARERLAAAGDDLERLQALAAQTVRPVAELTRDLAEVQLHTAQTRLEADRLREGFEAQLRPLERQRELTRSNLELQRVQSALATNRATVERVRLQAEAAALQRVARGREDPAAGDLTPRQRAIALALQERRLLLEQLDLTEQQRAAEGDLNQQITAVQRRRDEVLEPYERLLAIDQERAAQLQVQLQQWGLFKLDLEAATARADALHKALGGDDATHREQVRTAQQRGQAVADAWLASFQEWVDANGGTAWTAIVASLTKWTLEVGVPAAAKVGAQLAGAVYSGFVQAWEEAMKDNPLLKVFTESVARGAAGPALGAVPGVVQGVQAVQQGGVTNTIGDVTVTVGGVDDPGFAERIKAALEDFLRKIVVTQATTDPGAAARLQGAGGVP